MCDTCNSDYELSHDNTECNEIGVSETVKSQVISTQSVAGLSSFAAVISSSLNLSSPIGLWIIINQFQLLILILFFGVYIPKDVKDYILGMDFMSFSLNFILFDKMPFLKDIINLLDSEQNDARFIDIGANSGSSFVNNFSMIVIVILQAIIHLTYIPVYYIIKCKLPDDSNSKLNIVCNQIFYFFTFNSYVRIFLEANQFVLLTTCSEIYHMNFSTTAKLVSLNIAFAFA